MVVNLKIFCAFVVIIGLANLSCKNESSTEPIVTIPVLTTITASAVTQSTAASGGDIVSDGGATIITRGVCWSTNPNPTIEEYKTIDGTGTGSFESNLTGLTHSTEYFVRAYATNNLGTGYGNTVSFTTEQGIYNSFGLDSSKILNLISLIENNTYPEIHSLLIVKNDSLLFEKYFNGYARNYSHTLQSVTKSFTSAIIGIALEQGVIGSLENKILDYFPQYTNIENMSDWKREIEIKDLLTMRSGTDYSEGFPNSPHDQLNSLRSGWDIFYLNRPMVAEPGTLFNYDSGGVILLSAILKSACGMHADIFADQYLFPKLGISVKRWFKNDEGHPHTGGGLYLRPSDMIKLGMLYLHKGIWNGEQVVPESWVNKSFETHVDLTTVYTGDPYIRGYGYLWWILKPGGKSRTNEYVYAAMGALGQYIFVIPEYDMVVSVTSGATTYEHYQNPQRFLYDYILDAVE